MELVIDPRFRGPDSSGNGGYACGRIAAFVEGPAQVTLRLPPPLGVPLLVADGRVWHGDVLVAEVEPGEVGLDPPEPPSWDEAVEAQHPDADSPFPNCFVCGALREDGLRIFAGRVAGRDVFAAPWVPSPDTVGEEFVWAALDCPGAYATGAMSGRGVIVLGRLTARVVRVPAAGERCVVVGWPLGSRGRKHEAGTALFAGDELLGLARAVWIEPRG